MLLGPRTGRCGAALAAGAPPAQLLPRKLLGLVVVADLRRPRPHELKLREAALAEELRDVALEAD
eukprot:6010315-Lingulodinium_polyedra.AAC.1